MNLVVRKVIQTGDSVGITLPPAWLRSQGLVRGDDVEVWFDEDLHVRKRTLEYSPEEGKDHDGRPKT